MSGRAIGIGLAVIAVVFGVSLWWFQTRAFYERVEGLEEIAVAGAVVAVSGYEGIDAGSSPLKLRGCFRIDPAALASTPVAEKPTPLVAPGWFDCFDAAAIGADLETGAAVAYVAARNEPDGFDRIVAVYPDGRAYMWRQLNEKFAE